MGANARGGRRGGLSTCFLASASDPLEYTGRVGVIGPRVADLPVKRTLSEDRRAQGMSANVLDCNEFSLVHNPSFHRGRIARYKGGEG